MIDGSKELIPGDHDSLMLLGSRAQAQLNDLSKKMSAMSLKSSGDLEYLLHDVESEIDKFQTRTEKTSGFFRFRSAKREHMDQIRQYKTTLSYLEKKEEELKLQEIQLLKEASVYEQLEPELEQCCAVLEADLKAGQSTLEQKCVGNMSGKETDEALQRWYDQLEQKLQDLRISHITALQSRGQIRLMRENDCQLIDRISAALNGVFPVWRNQITMLLANTKKKFSNRNSKK